MWQSKPRKAAWLREGVSWVRACKLSRGESSGGRGSVYYKCSPNYRLLIPKQQLIRAWASGKTQINSSPHLEKASSRPSSNSCQTEKTHTHTHRLNSEFLSYEVITVLFYYTLTCTKSPLCSREVELCCLQPHTLASYVIRPVLFNRLLCASSRQRLGCRIHSFEYNRYSTSLGRLITISSTAVFLSSWNSWNVLTSPSLVLPIQYCCSLLRDYAP